MGLEGRMRLIVIGILVGVALVTLPLLVYGISNENLIGYILVVLLITGMLVLGVCCVELVTHLWLRGRPSIILALICLFFLSFMISVYAARLDQDIQGNTTYVGFLAVALCAYLLLTCWAFLANAIDKPVTRSQAMLGGATANFLIGFLIVYELDASYLNEVYLLSLILAFTIISSSLAWSSFLEVDEAEVSSVKRRRLWSAIEAILFTLIAPMLMLLWILSTMYFTG